MTKAIRDILVVVLMLAAGPTCATTLYTGSANIWQVDTVTGASLLVYDYTDTRRSFSSFASSPLPGVIYGVGPVYDAAGSAWQVGCLQAISVDGTLIRLVGCAGIDSVAIGFDANHNVLFGSAAGNLYTINQSTGGATLVGPFNGPTIMAGMTYDAGTNVLYGAAGTSIYTIGTSTGLATKVGDVNRLGYTQISVMGDIYIDPVTGQMFGIGGYASPRPPPAPPSGAYTLLEIDKATGVWTRWLWGPAGGGLAAPLPLPPPPVATAIPTLSREALAAMALLVLACGLLLRRRRRQ